MHIWAIELAEELRTRLCDHGLDVRPGAVASVRPGDAVVSGGPLDGLPPGTTHVRLSDPGAVAPVAARLRLAARAAGTARGDDHEVSRPDGLTATELRLWEHLARHRDRVISREELLSTVWGYDFEPDSNIVDVYVRYLRAKLGASAITTVRGAGYRLDEV